MIGVGLRGPLGRDEVTPETSGPRPGSGPWSPSVVAERDALAMLVSVDGLGPVGLGRLLARLGGGSGVLAVSERPDAVAILVDAGRDEEGRLGIGSAVASRILAAAAEADRILAGIRAVGVVPVTILDPEYPARLRSIGLPPHVLFVRGDPRALSQDHAVAVVGSRRPTDGGRRLAGQIGGALARSGAVVVSGLAVGIDGAAHAAVVAEGLPTVAVLGGGHRSLYPRAHARLAEEIVTAGGAVISELAPDVPATAGTFPRRNRLISGLADATVVVEAAARSGALTTAAWALEQGRGCFLVPGSIEAPMSAGCLGFLRECPGEARVVAGIPQLLEDLGLSETADRGADGSAGERRVRSRATPAGPGAAGAIAALGATERRIAEALTAGLATVDELCASLDLPVAAVLGALTLLEGRGLVTAAYGRYRPAGALAAMPATRGQRGAS